MSERPRSAISSKPNPTDGHVGLLAARYPLLIQDLAIWRKGCQLVPSLETNRQSPCWFTAGHKKYLLNDYDGQVATHLLAQLSDGCQIVHMFHNPQHFLLFMSQPRAGQCLQDARWIPWVHLSQSMHLKDWCRSTPTYEWPWACTRVPIPDGPALVMARELVPWLINLLNRMGGEVVHRIMPRYANRPSPGDILRQGERRPRVLVTAMRQTSYQGYCARDIEGALKACGVETRLALTESTPARGYEILTLIEEFDPDVLLVNGEARVHFPGVPEKLCIVSWDQDYILVSQSQCIRRRGPYDRIFVMVKDWLEDARLTRIPRDTVGYLNLGTNPEIYCPPPSPLQPEYDVLFVGNIYPWEIYKQIIGFNRLDQRSQRILEHGRTRLAEWVRNREDGEAMIIPEMDRFLHECADELNMPWADRQVPRMIKYYFRYRVAHFVLRELYVSALAEFRLELFGHGWDKVPAVAAKAHPPIENGPDLRSAIYRSAINLHLHTWTVHHPRLYDTAAAGGFLLVGRVPEERPLDVVFEPGRELETFGSIAELKRKVRYYLEHSGERKEMARRAAERALREHTMAQRMGQLLEALQTDGQPKDNGVGGRARDCAACSV